MDFLGFKVGRQVVEQAIHLFSRGHTIVADEWKGNDEDLSAIRGVCYGLGIAHHSRLEDEFASYTLVCTEALTEANIAILELQGHVLTFIAEGGHGEWKWRQLEGLDSL